MKKEYRKPMVVFESFALATNIAGDCEVKTWTPARGTCAYSVVDTSLGKTWNVFTSEVSACTTKEATLDGLTDGMYNGICYHTFADNSLFNS